MQTITKQDRFKHFFFELNNLTFELFKEKFVTHLSINTSYSITIKLCSAEEQVYKMIGNQVGFNLTEINIEQLYNTILQRVDMYSELYGIEDTVRSIELIYKVISLDKELALRDIDKIKLDKNLVSIKNTKQLFSFRLLPLTTNLKYYGRHLVNKEREEVVSRFKLYSTEDFTSNSNIFLYDAPKQQEIIVVNTKNNISDILIYDYVKGFYICKVKDITISTDSFTRTINNVTFLIKNEDTQQIEITKRLNAIQYKQTRHADRNKNIGSFDLETFKDVDGHSKVYAIGFKTSMDIDSNIFYLTDIDNNYSSDKLILTCLNTMLQTKYRGFTFYAHNFARYDFIFIYNIIKKYNYDKGTEYYKLTLSTRDDKIIKLTIQIKPESGKPIKIYIVDSLNLLNFSLEKLSLDFGLTKQKTHFPYSFVKRDTLLYVGPSPSKEYYPRLNNNTNESLSIYKTLFKMDWDLRKETIYYLNNDLNILLEIMNEFSRRVYIDHNEELTGASTISRLSMNIFLHKYLGTHKIPSITNNSMFSFIKQAYFGGITEVYKPIGDNLKLVDINSLYPYSALKTMPGLNSTYLENFKEGLDLDNLFGFFYALVESTPNTYFGLLPLNDTKGLIFPNGKYTGIWSSEELKFAKENGYTIKVIKGFNFNKVDSPFTQYVQEMFKLKNEAHGSNKTIFKSLLNNLIGRFGLDIHKPITKEVNLKERDYLASTREIKTQHILQDNSILLTYNPNISKQICEEHGLNYTKVLEKESKHRISIEINTFKDTSIACAAMINSYARVYMNSLKLELFNKGSQIYYMDTDSLVIDNKGFDILNDRKLIGKDIGQFKLEYEINKGYFISNKTYCLITNQTHNNTIIKAKGVTKNTLTVKNFQDLYNNININANRQNTVINYEQSYVDINNKNIILKHNSYLKRSKIHNSEGLWIDTKPLKIDTL